MIVVHINARDHEEAHVASAKFLLLAADLRRAEAEVARQLAVTVRWAEEKEMLIGHAKAYLSWGGEEARMLSTTGGEVEVKGSELPAGKADAETGITVIVFGGELEDAGQTGAVLAAGAALGALSILEHGGKRFLLLPMVALNAFLLAEMDVAGALLALLGVLLLALIPYGKTLGGLCRWGCLIALTLALGCWRILGPGPALVLTVLAGACLLGERRLPGERDCRLLSLLLLGFLCLFGLGLALSYEGWYAPLREASALLRGEVSDSMGSGRVYIWRQVMRALPERFWLGSGPDTLGLRGLAPYRAYDPALGRETALQIDAAHCEVLQTLVCCGPGAAACHLGLGVCAALGFFRKTGTARLCAGAAFCYALQALFGISMCASAPLFWGLLALSVQTAKQGGEDPREGNASK